MGRQMWRRRSYGPPRALEANDDELGDEVRHERDDHEDRSEVEDRGGLLEARGADVFGGDLAAERVARLEPRRRDRVVVPNRLIDGDRLAERPPEPEEHGRDDSRRRVREHDASYRLPPRRAESECSVREVARYPDEELAADRRRDRDDHDRQHEARREQAPTALRRVAREHRQPAENVAEKWVEVL